MLQKLRRKKKRDIFIPRRQTVSEGEACEPGDTPKLQRRQLGGQGEAEAPSPWGSQPAEKGDNASLPLVQPMLAQSYTFSNFYFIFYLNNLHNSLNSQFFLKFPYKRFFSEVF